MQTHNIAGIIFSGGKSSRMGTDKALITISGSTLLQTQTKLLKPIFNSIYISANTNYKNTEITIINDININTGPIGGIHACLKKVEQEKIFILAIDMPFVTNIIINNLIKQNNGYDITIPIINGKQEPLCAIYSKECLNIIEKQISKQNYKLIDFIKNSNTNYVEFNNEDLQCFKNLNTLNDIENLR